MMLEKDRLYFHDGTYIRVLEPKETHCIVQCWWRSIKGSYSIITSLSQWEIDKGLFIIVDDVADFLALVLES